MPTKPKAGSSLSAALLIAQQTLKGVEKDGKNKFHGYDYASSEGMLTAAREALHAAGLVCAVTGNDVEIVDGLCLNRLYLRLMHPETDTAIEMSRAFPIVPEKGRPMDKATCGALTTCLSYTLRDLLLIPRVDQTLEINERDDRNYTPQNKSNRNGANSNGSRPANTNGGASLTFARRKCPACNSRVRDNRNDKRARAANVPVFKCDNRECKGGKDGAYPWGTYDQRWDDDPPAGNAEPGPMPDHGRNYDDYPEAR